MSDVVLSGNLDQVSADGFISGWCFVPAEPHDRRRLSVELDGHEVAVIDADQSRPDLVQAGVGDGAHAFAFQLPPEAIGRAIHSTVALRDIASGQQLGPDVAVTWDLPDGAGAGPSWPLPADALAGNLDRVTRDGWVSGWCWYPESPGRRADVAIFVDDERVGEVRADQFRPDLRYAGVGDGAHGFSFALPWAVLARKGRLTVAVREHPGGMPLGEEMTLRFGRLAAAEERIEDLERQLRVLRATLAEAKRERGAQEEERSARALFRTVGAFFQELAEAPRDAGAAGLTAGLRGAVSDIFQRFPPITLARPAGPLATICIDADAPLELLYRCFADLRACGVDEIAEIVLADDGSHGAAPTLLPSIVGNLTYVRMTGPGGCLAARNAVARTRAAPALVFLAAGLRITREFLPTLLDTLDREPEAVLVSSPVVLEDGTLRHFGLLIEPATGALSWRDHRVAETAGQSAVSFLRDVDGVADYAYAVRTQAFLAESGFFEGFSTRAAATLDLCLRMRRAGGRVMAQPKAALVWPENAASLTTAALEADRGAPDPNEPAEDITLLRQRQAGGVPPPCVIGRALVIDTEIPRPDHDAGSVAALEHMRLLRQLGYLVTFIASNDPQGRDPGSVERLERAGIEVVGVQDTRSVSQLLEAEGGEFDIVELHRHTNATLFLERVRELAPRARIVFSPSDLHFLREQRERALNGRGGPAPGQDTTREDELAAIAAADATILFSDAEVALLAGDVDPAKLHLLRWVARPIADPPSFARRSGLCFVGNFRHPPNVDAVGWFVTEVMPLLVRAEPGLRCHVVGDEAPAALLALASASVVFHGWVEDLASLLSSARIGLAPLRFGAGFKGKVAASLECGTPVVGTPIAFEGTGLLDGDGIRVAEDTIGLADAILDIVRNEAEWTQLSARGIERCAALYSEAAARDVFRTMLGSLGVPCR